MIDDSKKTDPMACDVPCGGDATHICGGGWLLSVFQKVSTSPTTPSIRGWRHSWCYTDSEERTLSGRMQTSSDMTPSRCAQFCCGWEYFGIENGNECKHPRVPLLFPYRRFKTFYITLWSLDSLASSFFTFFDILQL